MQDLRARLQAADTLLAPYAVPHGGLLGREVAEPNDETRTPFQRDRDRIIHTQAFRRLQGKTQVFVAGEESDHVRTRLTHTMEVAQIARDVARTFGLNEDLTECIALAHDLGHSPFGHRGEEALHAWVKKHGLHFEHNDQTLRVVTVLETQSPLRRGLNLNREVLEGLRKHRRASEEGSPFPRSMTLEAQIVDHADAVAYLGHDTDDGLRAGLFSLDDLRLLPVISQAETLAKKRGTLLRSALIHLLIMDLNEETHRLLRERNVQTLDEVYASTAPLVSFSAALRRELAQLRSFLFERMYEHPRVRERSVEGQRIIHLLCDHYLTEPPAKVLELQEATGSSLPEAVKDYVAGMTDGFAATQAASIE